MSLQQQILSDFTAGELSPRMMGRFDLQPYYRGAQLIQNMIPFFPGGATLRPGFMRVGAPKGAARVRLHSFIISNTLSYILEIGPLYIRFWKNNALVGGGTPVEIVTPWGAGDLDALQFVQSQATLYIASGSAPVKTLAMTAADTFSFGDLTITGLVGEVPFQGAGNYPRAIAIHDGRLYLACTDNEPQTIWASKPFDFGNFVYWETISSTSKQLREPLNAFSGNTTNGSTTVSGIATEEIAGFKVGDRITGPGIVNKPRVVFACATTSGSNILANVSSSAIAQLAVGETVTGQNIPAATIQSIGANTVTISQNATGTNSTSSAERAERASKIESIGATSVVLTIAATATATAAALHDGWADPTVPEYQDVTTTRDVVTSASAFKKTVASDQNERILWLAAGRDLVVGSTTGERVVPTGANAVTFTCKRQTAIGSVAIQPFMLNEAVIFVESNGRGAREYVYSQDEEAYQSPSLTALADHALQGEVQEADYQNTPIPIVWFVLKDGKLAACAYSRIYQLAAWFRAEAAQGMVESLAVIPGATQDAVYIMVNRGGTRSLERMGAIFGSEGHLDAAATATKTAGQITGISWITGAATVVHAGAAYQVTIAGGTAALPAAIADGQQVLIGLPFEGRIKTMPLNAQAALGSAHMRPKTVVKANAKILASYPFKLGFEEGALERATFTGPATGDYPIPVLGTWDSEGSLVIVQDEPFDLTVLAIAPEIDAGG